MSSSQPLGAEVGDLLWVPLLTHYASDGSGLVDPRRMIAHLTSIRESVGQIMLAGSTGDGWELDDRGFDALIDLAASADMQALDPQLLFGILQTSAAEVVARLHHLEARLEASPDLKKRFRGVAVCPPVNPAASQEEILSHYRAIMDASRSPIAVYQLPQVTGCRIEPNTLTQLSREHPRVVMFKDSSGEDQVARSAAAFGDVVLVRGAEGGYLEALSPVGPYHGWLLSTGNALGRPLRRVLELRASGSTDEAARLSAGISDVVDAVFTSARNEGGANAFSNANRAMDHLRAYGESWRDAPLPFKVNGKMLSRSLIEIVEGRAAELLDFGGPGYLSRGR